MAQSIMKTMSPIFLKQMNSKEGQKASQSNKQHITVTNNELAVYPPEMYEEVLIYFRANHYKC